MYIILLMVAPDAVVSTNQLHLIMCKNWNLKYDFWNIVYKFVFLYKEKCNALWLYCHLGAATYFSL